ncbi:centrosomal protein of 44 kDa [Denticeps clupeoides]|uniref:centrosomal protein of 44 kDa n=1 Tax=Denticeps clupeoides TaxID=299321 RepID=UPI0010A58D0A|nr:centrosomal protein of 44 kDa [Denticeps clupeoides]
MATGDIKGRLRKLQVLLRSLKYHCEVDYHGLAKGDPSCFLPIMNHAFTSFSPFLTEHLMSFGVEVTGTSDQRFLECVYKILRDIFHYKPLLSKQQFHQFGFAERKVSLLCDVITFVVQKHKELSNSSKVSSQSDRRPRFKPFPPEGKSRREVSPSFIEAYPPPTLAVIHDRPLVERHVGSYTPVLYSLSSDEPEQEPPEDEEHDLEEEENQEDDGDKNPQQETVLLTIAPAVEVRLQAIESRLQECERKLGQLTVLEGRLEVLERDMAGKVVLERSQWENVESRLLLLEARLALSSVQKHPVRVERVEGCSVNETFGPADVDPGRHCATTLSQLHSKNLRTQTKSPSEPSSQDPQDNIKESLERIASMIKGTSSLLRNVE